MSWLVLGWAEEAPVADVYERSILMQMAARADKDGCGVYLSPVTLARRTVSDEQTMKRRLRTMRERGLIAYGDQARAAHIPANRRPKVYDLMVPATAYTARDLRLVNEERAEHGLPPLTPENRPDLADVEPSRRRRSDLGVPRERHPEDEQSMTWENFQGGLVDTPESDPPESPGGSTRPGQGGLVDTPRGVYETPKSVSSNQSEKSPNGGPTGERHQRAGTPVSDDPPPPSELLWWQDPTRWHCRDHLTVLADDPGADIPPCQRCARVKGDARPRFEAWRAETAASTAERERIDRIADAEAKRAERAAAQAAAQAVLGSGGHAEFLRARAELAAKRGAPVPKQRRRRRKLVDEPAGGGEVFVEAEPAGETLVGAEC